MDKIVLYDEEKVCCGCGACMNICPQNAITMSEDTRGFKYPFIDANKCVGCGICKKVCAYQNVQNLYEPLKVYAAMSNDVEEVKKSASGGIFVVLSKQVIKNGGYVFGATMSKERERLVVKHISINREKDISLLQGSKYVQSSIGNSYQEVERLLKENYQVLFTGTPCQIAGLKGYLKRDYDNLITIDIICHGVPSEKFFNDYLILLMKKNRGEIENFVFRDKTKGWGLTAKYSYIKQNGRIKTKLIPFNCSSFYSMFINGEIYRENCYSCPYARRERIGDITIGDFWGIAKRHPEFMKVNSGFFDEEIGVSCILVNSKKGDEMLKCVDEELIMKESSFQKVAMENHQLLNPTKMPDTRSKIMSLYEEGGYKKVEDFFKKRIGLRIYYYGCKNVIPRPLKRFVKKIINFK